MVNIWVETHNKVLNATYKSTLNWQSLIRKRKVLNTKEKNFIMITYLYQLLYIQNTGLVGSGSILIVGIHRKGPTCLVGAVLNPHAVCFKVLILDVLLNSPVSFANACLKKEIHIACLTIRVLILFNLKEGPKITSSGLIKSPHTGH